MRMLRTVAPLVLLLSPALAAAAGRPAPAAPRTFAVIPFYSSEKMWQLYAPFVEYLRRETGEAWELKLPASHEEMIAAVCGGKVDLALLGPVPLGRVNRTCDAVPVLVALGKDGVPTYRSMLLTNEPAVTSVAGLRGKRIGLFKGSTAAHVLPLKMLGDAGLGPKDYTPVYLESQDRIMTGLLSREIDAAGVKEALYRRFEKEPLKLIATSEPLPNFALAVLSARRSAAVDRVVARLLALRPRARAADAKAVKGWDDEIKNGFVTPAADFLPAVLRVRDTFEAVMHDAR